MQKLTTCILFLYFTIPLFSQEVKDTLFLKNGTVLIGEIKKIKLGEITFSADDANTNTVQLKKLITFSGTQKIYRIELINHVVYYGKVHALRDSNKICVSHGQDDTINIQSISLLYPFKDAFINRFTGNIGAGINYTRSGNLGRFNVDGRLDYSAKKEEISLTISGIYTLTDSTFTRDREEVGLK